MPTLDDCHLWQSGECEWTIRHLWRWMSSFGHLDVILLALMLVYLFAVLIHVCCRYYLARRAGGIDGAGRRRLAAFLSIEAGDLKSIAVTAPYLGLAGTCVGILYAFSAFSGSKGAVMAMIATKVAIALIPTAVAIPLAVLATCSYNYLRSRIDLLVSEAFEQGWQRSRHFRGARRFPPTERFSEFPAFAPFAAFGLALLGFIVLPSLHPPKGFYVGPASAHCEYEGDEQLIVLHITDEGKLFLNQEQEYWTNLADRLSAIYSMREHRTLYLLADPGVPFRTVADALDIVEGASATPGSQADGMRNNNLGIKVQLVTPKALTADCFKPVVTGSGRHALR